MEPAEPTTSKKQSQKEPGEKKDPEKSTAIIDRGLPGMVFCQKLHSRTGAGGIFAKSKRGKRGPKIAFTHRTARLKGPQEAPWGDLGSPWGALWGTLGGPWGALRGPRGTLGHQFLQTGALRKSLVLRYKWIHLDCLSASGGTIRGDVLDQSWPPKTARRQEGRPRQREDDRWEPKGAHEPPQGAQRRPRHVLAILVSGPWAQWGGP